MSRAEQTQAERRRRNTSLSGRRRRFSVDKSKMDDGYVYRFANDDAGRIYDLTVMDDYDVVSDREATIKPDGEGMGTQVAVHAGRTQDGKPMRAVLLRKPRALYDDDQAAKARHIDEQEAGLRAGRVPGVDSASQYTPKDSKISLTRG